MRIEVKKEITRIYTAGILTLLFAGSAPANVYQPLQTEPEVGSANIAPITIAQARKWGRLKKPQNFTTLFLTFHGLSYRTPETSIKSAPGLTATTPLSSLPRNPTQRASSGLEIATAIRATVRPDNKADLTTASVPTPAAPPSQLTDPTLAATLVVRQDLPLFGAHRIRFGKIGSGVKVSSLIRQAATLGSSAICMNQCADLADRLALPGASLKDQFRHISRSVNKMVIYQTDQQSHGRLDQWSTPNETLRRGAGDCEDYAILKMALLSHLGIPMDAMEIVVLKDTRRRLFHAVLSVSVGGNSLILDNMTDAVEIDTAKPSYAPLFSISGSANYIFGYKGGKSGLVASLAELRSVAPGAGF
ncbi:transglutaminase-like cysteine peptidase [Hoeflea sp. YIM 152468]|uniref:transglutaminase-like cysteine peptidase n=1 Tax=Hoeflea sp. YIM 152468 TaxID=3031759 RepID=UPI0023DB2B53|nr:transglutaminase-like cysteine peptidase [Hoeflea sp. YIM 152468]MDF1610100.1 transglutaminase-like cysteine peptidase [Hoeflea sp. YIM 152468]